MTETLALPSSQPWLGLKLWSWPAFVLGVIVSCVCVQHQASLPDQVSLTLSLAGAVVLAVVMLCLAAHRYTKAAKSRLQIGGLAMLTLIGYCLGASWAAYDGAARVADGWPAAYEGKDIVATGYVATMPTLGTASQRVQFVIESNNTDTLLNGKTVALSWYYGTFNLQPAQRYNLVFRARQRHGGMNPQGFDYELWLLARGIAATGYIRAAPTDLQTQVRGFFPWVERARGYIRNQLFASSNQVEAARWAAALALGDQRSLSDADWQRYNATGTGHLLAVSGTHITLMGALLAWLAACWWRAKPQRLLRLPVQTLRLNVMLGSSWAYALIAGWALPAQRTVFMLTAAWLALRFMAKPAIWHVMACSAAVAIAFEPLAVISPSFWLSYGAVAALIAIELGALKPQVNAQLDPTMPSPETLNAPVSAWQARWLVFKQVARSQLLLTLALVPLGAVFFNQISIVSPLANAVAIPIMGWVSTPIALVAAALSLVWSGTAGALMQTLLAVQQGMDGVLDALLWLPHAQLFVPSAPLPWALLGMCAAVGCVFARRLWRWAAVLGVGVYVAGAYAFAAQPASGWRAVFLDVGQGMSVVVHSQGKTLLFDVGPRYSADSDGAARIVVPYLRAVGVSTLDHVVLSHADDDHTGGTRSLLARMPVGQWWHSISPSHPLHVALPGSKKRCTAGESWQWAGLSLQWLHPLANLNFEQNTSNGVACVLRVSDGLHSVLLAADIEAAQEQSLLDKYGIGLASTVLLAPHHGSKTSSTQAFLKAVNPQHVVIQNGYRNRFGHPHPSVTQRYLDLNIRQWRSDAHGAVVVDIRDSNVSITPWRQHAQRYWHTQLPVANELRQQVDGRDF